MTLFRRQANMVNYNTVWRERGCAFDPFRTIHPLDGETGWFWQSLVPIKQHNLVVVTGITGVGKSLYASHYKEKFQSCSCIFATKGMQPSNLLKALVQRLALDLRLDQVTLESKKQAVISVLMKMPHESLLIIDDAHNLPNETILFIQDLLCSAAGLKLRVVMVGLPILSDRVSMLLDKNRDDLSMTTVVVSPMNKSQVREYLCHKLRAAGLDIETLNEPAVSRVYELSSGVARDVNRMATMSLENLLSSPIKSTPLRSPVVSVNSLSVYYTPTFIVLSMCLWLFVIYSGRGVWHAFHFKDQMMPVMQATHKPMKQDRQAIESPAPTVQAKISDPVVTQLNKAAVLAKADEEHIRHEPSHMVVAHDLSHTAIEHILAENLVDHHALQQKIIADTTDLMKMNGYLVQVAATKELQEVKDFSAMFAGQDLRITLAERSGQVWYVLLIGPATDYKGAERVRQHLSESQQQFKPWIRSLKQLHEDIVMAEQHEKSNEILFA